MSWPAPDLLSPPSAPPMPDDAPPESDLERRRRSAAPAAAWVAVVGGALVLVAAAILVVANWDTLGRGVRFGGLVAGTAGLLFAAERLRRQVPTSAGIIAHVGTFLTAAIGIAGMSLFGFTWPACLLVGGAVAAAATEAQSRRWARHTILVGQVAGIAIASVGLADLTGTTGGLIAALVAIGLMAAGADRRAAGLSVLAVLSPALTAVADAGIGSGTFERAGLVGERLSWSGPVVGVLAAMVLGAVGLRRRNNGLVMAAVAAPVVGVVTGLAAVDGPAAAWWSMPALVVIAAELGWWMLPSERLRRPITTTIDVVSGGVAALATLAPFYVAVADWTDDVDVAAVPAAVTAFALALATLRWIRSDRQLSDLGIAATASTLLALALALPLGAFAVAVVAVGLVVAAAFLSRRLHPAAVLVPAGWASLAIVMTVGDGESWRIAAALSLLAGLASVVLAARTRLAADNHWMGWVEMFLVTAAAAGSAAAIVGEHHATVALAAAALVAGAVMIIDRRFVTWAPVSLAVVALFGVEATTRTWPIDGAVVIGWATVTAAFAATWFVHRDHVASAATAASAVLTAAAAAASLAITTHQFVGLAMLAVVVLTGITITFGRRIELDAAAVTAGAVLFLSTALDISASWMAAAVVVIGAQIVIAGSSLRLPVVVGIGSLITAGGAWTWWIESGLHDWFVAFIEPAGITAGDVWMAAATGLALAGGVAIRRHSDVNSWVAYSATLVVAALWLLPVLAERDTVWALPLALVISLGAVGLGAWHRLAAPLVGGTILTAANLFVATGSDLRAVPAWVWFAIGGVGLLGTAVVIERAGRTDGSLTDLVQRWQ